MSASQERITLPGVHAALAGLSFVAIVQLASVARPLAPFLEMALWGFSLSIVLNLGHYALDNYADFRPRPKSLSLAILLYCLFHFVHQAAFLAPLAGVGGLVAHHSFPAGAVLLFFGLLISFCLLVVRMKREFAIDGRLKALSSKIQEQSLRLQEANQQSAAGCEQPAEWWEEKSSEYNRCVDEWNRLAAEKGMWLPKALTPTPLTRAELTRVNGRAR